MLEKLHRVARRLTPYQNVALGLAAASIIAVVVILLALEPAGSDYYLYPLIVLFLWFLSIYALIDCFKEIPGHPRAQKGFIRKAKAGISRSWSWLMGILFIASTLGVIALSWKLISLWIKDY
ncbi:MAG: hypothetical protein ABW090_17175 [Sedimenticola sp.]